MRIKLLDRIVIPETRAVNVLTQTGGVNGIVTDYSQLKGIPMAKAIVKHYLAGYVKSDFRAITPEELVVAALLPVQRFQKGSAQEAYIETAKRY